MDYVSDKQRKAVMAKINNDGLLDEKFRNYSYDYSRGSYPSNNNISELRKTRLRKIRLKCYDYSHVSYPLNRCNDSKGWASHPLNEQHNKKTLVKTMIEDILALKTIEDPEEKILLSHIFNNIVRIAEENGTNKNIIIELREIQQQLIKNTPGKILMTKLQETKKKLEMDMNITQKRKCPYCNKSFNDESGCNQHIKDKHGVS